MRCVCVIHAMFTDAVALLLILDCGKRLKHENTSKLDKH